MLLHSCVFLQQPTKPTTLEQQTQNQIARTIL